MKSITNSNVNAFILENAYLFTIVVTELVTTIDDRESEGL